MNLQSILCESSIITDPVLLYICEHAKPNKTFTNNIINSNDKFQNKIEHKSEVYFDIFRDKLASLVKHYSSITFPHGLAWGEVGKYTIQNIGGRYRILWHQDYPADILMQFVKKYVDLVNNFLPVTVYIAPDVIGPEDWYYTYVHTMQGININSVVILFYDYNKY